MKTGQTSPFLGFTKKKSSTLPRVVWVEESRNGIGFEIGPKYDDVPTMSQLLTDRFPLPTGLRKNAVYICRAYCSSTHCEN